MAVPGQLTYARRLGPAARLAIWLMIGLACVVIDTRMRTLDSVRGGLSLMLQPVREALRAPTEVGTEIAGFLTRHRLLQKERDALLAERARLLMLEQAALDLERENAELRALHDLRQRPGRQVVQAARLYQGQDWFAQTLHLDRGATSGLRGGLPVIDETGLLGQVSRVYPNSSEVTLVSSPGQLTPVMNERTGQRGLVAGLGQGRLELRFMPLHADVQTGDRLLTSGIDGRYPPALPVAEVGRIGRSQTSPYLRVDCTPLAGIDRARTVLVLVAAPREARP